MKRQNLHSRWSPEEDQAVLVNLVNASNRSQSIEILSEHLGRSYPSISSRYYVHLYDTKSDTLRENVFERVVSVPPIDVPEDKKTSKKEGRKVLEKFTVDSGGNSGKDKANLDISLGKDSDGEPTAKFKVRQLKDLAMSIDTLAVIQLLINDLTGKEKQELVIELTKSL